MGNIMLRSLIVIGLVSAVAADTRCNIGRAEVIAAGKDCLNDFNALNDCPDNPNPTHGDKDKCQLALGNLGKDLNILTLQTNKAHLACMKVAPSPKCQDDLTRFAGNIGKMFE